MSEVPSIRSVEDWEVVFEPGAVMVVESIHGRDSEARTVELHIERYEFADGLLRRCATEQEVTAALRDIGVSEAKATAYAPHLWRVMHDYLEHGS